MPVHLNRVKVESRKITFPILMDFASVRGPHPAKQGVPLQTELKLTDNIYIPRLGSVPKIGPWFHSPTL